MTLWDYRYQSTENAFFSHSKMGNKVLSAETINNYWGGLLLAYDWFKLLLDWRDLVNKYHFAHTFRNFINFSLVHEEKDKFLKSNNLRHGKMEKLAAAEGVGKFFPRPKVHFCWFRMSIWGVGGISGRSPSSLHTKCRHSSR